MENNSHGKIFHQQIKLPLFPVIYDVFFCNDAFIAPRIIEDKYPGLSITTDPGFNSMTSLIKHPLKGTGIVSIFLVSDDENAPDIRDLIVFESSNIVWNILEELDIGIASETMRIYSYILEEVNREITKAYEDYMDIDPNEELDNSDGDFDDL